MSYNSKAFLDYQERQLEPEQLIQGHYPRYKPLANVAPWMRPPPVELSEHEQIRKEDEFLKKHNI